MSKEFVHLHVHSQYSLLDGFSQIPKLMERANELNMGAMGLTDHGTMFGVIDFFNEAQKAGVKPIIGVEAYMAARSMGDRDSKLDRKSTHLLLLAENQAGYQNLLKLASKAQTDGFYYYPRVDRDLLAQHAEGLIVTSGCMSAEVPRALLQDNPDEAKRHLSWYYDVFGKDNFFIELQDHDIPEIPKLNRELIELGKQFDLNFVATNDVHYVDKDDADLQDILLCVQTSSLYNDPKRMKMTDESYYLKSAAEMDKLFGHIPGAMENTLLIAERCEVELNRDEYVLPKFEVPEGFEGKSYLRHLCDQGLEMRYGADATKEVYQERLEYELGIIDEMGFNAYFLIVWDMCMFSQREGIWYNARGSAAGSLVAYALEITLVDPIEHQLIFERFLNPGRVSMPDIDLDFQDDKRHLLLEYTAQKYGDDKVAAIITFGKMKARAAVRDVGRVLDIPLHEVDRIAKLVPTGPNAMKLKNAIKKVPELQEMYRTNPQIKRLLDNASQIEGSLRNAGTHAAGVVVTDKPITEYIPVHRPTSNAEDTPIKTITQFEMQTIDALKLLKVDFLGLSTLTVMQRACELIEQRHGKTYDLHNIPLDDKATYEFLGAGNTAGIFQLEGGGMTRWVMEMKPQVLDHLIAMVALYRPGPMEFIPSYIARMQGKEDVEYLHPDLEPILGETYGITVYQEQIMYTAMNLGGYTASDADFLRKSVAKKKEKELLENREMFVSGAAKNGVSKEAAEAIFANWEAFARYGFPKGHAADYAVISVETAYLKCHYPEEYMTALLSVFKDNSDKVKAYVADCRNNLEIEVLQPDINLSRWDFTIEDLGEDKNAIRYGMGAVKNVGFGPVETIITAREDGAFKDLNELAERIDLRKVGKRALESLIKAGAFDSFGPRLAMLAVMEQLMSISASTFDAAERGQTSFFGMDSGLTQRIELPEVNEHVNRREMLNWERDLIGLYISDHPLNEYMDQMRHIVTCFSSELPLKQTDQRVRVFGQVVRIRPHITKKNDAMAFVGLEDNQGVMELVVFPKTWNKFRDLFDFDNILIIEGSVDAKQGEPKILVDKVSTEASYVTAKEPPPPIDKGAFKPTQRPRHAPSPYVPESPPTSSAVAEEQAAEKQQVAEKQRAAEKRQVAEKQQATLPTVPEKQPEPKKQPAAEKQPKAKKQPEVEQPPEKKPAPVPLDVDYSDGPPPPPAFDDDMLEEWGIAPEELQYDQKPDEDFMEAVVAEDQEPFETEPVMTPVGQTETLLAAVEDNLGDIAPAEPVPSVPEPAEAPQPVTVATPVQQAEEQEDPLQKALPVLNSIVPDRPILESPASGNQRMLTVVVRASQDKARDILRIRRIHGMLLSYPGNDKFAIYLIEGGQGIRMEFPGDTTYINDELMGRLTQVVGRENVKIEPIVVQ